MTNEQLKRLIKLSHNWNSEDYGYICLSLRGSTYFSNGLDCDGARRWSKKSFQKMIERKALDSELNMAKETVYGDVEKTEITLNGRTIKKSKYRIGIPIWKVKEELENAKRNLNPDVYFGIEIEA